MRLHPALVLSFRVAGRQWPHQLVSGRLSRAVVGQIDCVAVCASALAESVQLSDVHHWFVSDRTSLQAATVAPVVRATPTPTHSLQALAGAVGERGLPRVALEQPPRLVAAMHVGYACLLLTALLVLSLCGSA